MPQHGILYGGHLVMANPENSVIRIVPKARLDERAVKVQGKPLKARSKRDLKEHLQRIGIDDGTIQKTLDHFMVRAKNAGQDRRELHEAGKDLAYLRPVQSAVYVSGGWTMRGDHVAGKINETELSTQQLKTMIDAGLIGLSPNGKKQFLAKFKSPAG